MMDKLQLGAGNGGYGISYGATEAQAPQQQQGMAFAPQLQDDGKFRVFVLPPFAQRAKSSLLDRVNLGFGMNDKGQLSVSAGLRNESHAEEMQKEGYRMYVLRRKMRCADLEAMIKNDIGVDCCSGLTIMYEGRQLNNASSGETLEEFGLEEDAQIDATSVFCSPCHCCG
jgi:hypothetical protein